MSEICCSLDKKQWNNKYRLENAELIKVGSPLKMETDFFTGDRKIFNLNSKIMTFRMMWWRGKWREDTKENIDKGFLEAVVRIQCYDWEE